MNKLDSSTKLYEIVASKKAALEAQKKRKPYAQLEQELSQAPAYAGKSFFDALKARTDGPKIIAEAKKASPSHGVIRGDFSLPDINAAYQSVPNVVAISVLTEKDYFQGGNEVLSFFAQNNTGEKPLLRKDFIFDPYQVLETKALGAQAYLLIASLFETAEELEELIKAGRELDLEALVEVHTQEELAMVKETSARVIGVNARDMKTLQVDLTVHKLLQAIDSAYARVAESGIGNPAYLQQISGYCDAALIGGHLMESADIKTAIERLVGRS